MMGSVGDKAKKVRDGWRAGGLGHRTLLQARPGTGQPGVAFVRVGLLSLCNENRANHHDVR